MSRVPPARATYLRELTAAGRGAIRVLRVEGPAALARVSALARGLDGRTPELEPGSFRLQSLRDAGGELLDQALVLVEGPERIELHLHGSPPILHAVQAALGLPAPPPQVGDLEEQARESLAASPSEAAARLLLDQSRGALRRALEELPRLEPGRALERIGELVRRGRVARRLLRPPTVVLAGPVNAGKSTLFNLLVGHERVIVDVAAGTTRDAVRERIRLGAYAVDLIDTAGERPTCGGGEQQVEREGQELARRLGAMADLVLWLEPACQRQRGGGSLAPADRASLRVLISRADEAGGPGPSAGPASSSAPALSALADPAGARRLVARTFHEALELPADPWLPGAAVPFTEDLLQRLESWLAGGPRPVAPSDLAEWLEGPGPGSPAGGEVARARRGARLRNGAGPGPA